MGKAAQTSKKLCPGGVPADCLYCIKSNGRAWDVLDPKDNPIDEASSQRKAVEIAEGYIAQCNASRSGYGTTSSGQRFDPKAGPIKWSR